MSMFSTRISTFNKLINTPFDVNDEFSLIEFSYNAANGMYSTKDSAAIDLARIYRYHIGGESYFIEKGVDERTHMKIFNYVRYETVHRKLKAITLYEEEIPMGKFTKSVPVTAWSAFLEYQHELSFDALRFNSDEPFVINYFHGYKWKVLPEYDEATISDFLTLTKEVIADSNEEVYEYLLDWVAYIIQNPGKKTMTSLILKGTQGAGKNTWTDILCELMSGYSQPNITRIEELTGQFNKVLEHCMFMVLNEMKSAKDSYVQNMDCLKAIITEPTLRIGEKFEPNRTVENVSNFVFISNHAKPLVVPANDRRYVVLLVNGKYKETEFLYNLHDLPDEFYDNLLTFFKSRDISKFDPKKIPMTDAKKDLIEACRTDYEDFIVENYDDFVSGIPYQTILSLYSRSSVREPDTNKPSKNFILALKDRCIKGGYLQVTRDGYRMRIYKLKSEYLDMYKPK